MINLNLLFDVVDFNKPDGEKIKTFLSVMNIDDIFITLKKIGIEEIEVNQEQMILIMRYVLANTKAEENLTIMKEGKIDKFFGIKLYLDE